MSSTVDKDRCEQTTLVSAYALRALPASEVPRLETHLSTGWSVEKSSRLCAR